MSNFAQEFEDDDQFQCTIISQSSNGSPNPTENDPDAEVVALSPRTLMATNRYICEVCHKGFQRDQNLQLHRRGHNLPWKLKQRPNTQVKKRVYVCPEPTCVHHDPSRALGDLTGIKKHFCRKHGEKKWKCDKCSKRYAVQSDWKAHTKICGTREYRCDSGTIFSRKDSFVTHRAFCDALAEENYKANRNLGATEGMLQSQAQELFTSAMPSSDSCSKKSSMMNLTISDENIDSSLRPLSLNSAGIMVSSYLNPTTSLACFSSADRSNVSPMAIGCACTSARALLQKAAEMGTKISDNSIAPILLRGFAGYSASSMNSSGSAQEGSSLVGSNMGTTAANTNSLCVGDTETFDKSSDPSYSRNVYTISENGLFESAFNMRSANGNASNSLVKEAHMGGGEKMTLNFLGVEPTGHTTMGKKRSYEGNIMGLGYSNVHQNLNNLHSDWYTRIELAQTCAVLPHSHLS
ncbi:zinc finger protein GAI-ASSOCIATED FACTOR 1-like [Hevea brasiliensis]|uniref:zinc finger protein GAI-ASSOCIATED FACTOR 1-like n=1 Tax=Hevea brasiliensis TaxID=3981 RepID=UPI0025F37694|nr:zinc finger protein GAI-ASSOCIATED FACTOR 1-like [Hevea brasiliensis]